METQDLENCTLRDHSVLARARYLLLSKLVVEKGLTGKSDILG